MFQIHEEGYVHDQTSSEEKVAQDEKFGFFSFFQDLFSGF